MDYFTGAVPCVICDRLTFDPQRVTCSDVCRDMWLGELGQVGGAR